jgi:hypothetical protein
VTASYSEYYLADYYSYFSGDINASISQRRMRIRDRSRPPGRTKGIRPSRKYRRNVDNGIELYAAACSGVRYSDSSTRARLHLRQRAAPDAKKATDTKSLALSVTYPP